MIPKRVLRPERLRVPPKSFSWIDHRLIRDGHLERLQPPEILLYFFLVLVGDAEGLSYYSLPTITRYLKLSLEALKGARQSLLERSLIAYSDPFYQVLALKEPEENKKLQERRRPPAPKDGNPTSIEETLKKLFKENPHGH